MDKMNRRTFLQSAGAAAAIGGLVLPAARAQQVAGANERLNVALIGCGGRGSFVIRVMVEDCGANCVALCDLSDERLDKCWKLLSDAQKVKPRFEKDHHKIMEAKDIDAIIVATPDNWHAPLAILGCQAGKDVYCEKPHSHNMWESGKIIEAAEKYNRIVQIGTQNRSKEYNLQAREIIKSGKLGKIGLVKVFNLKNGERFKIKDPGKQPANFDWDRWLGRAPLRPYHQGIFATGWHYFWEYCGGDLTDDGSHQMDLALMLMGDPGLPRSVRSMGGRFIHKGDDAEVPDVLNCAWDFKDFVMTLDMSQYPRYMEKSTDAIRRKTLVSDWMENSTRIEIYGQDLFMIIGRHGGGFVVEKGGSQVVEKVYGAAGDSEHYKNFIACCKSRKRPNGDVRLVHASNITMHMGNIAHRIGNTALNYDTEKGTFDNEAANKMIKEHYRKGYEIPEKV